MLLSCGKRVHDGTSPLNDNNAISVRNAHSMAYNAKDSRIYLFGGANEKEVLSELWVLDSINWQKVITDGEPQPRTFSSLIYDNKKDRLILFGGNKVLFGNKPDSQSLLNDTWEFKNNRWKKLNMNNSPSPRAEATMAYDERRETIVLFGGYHIQNEEYVKLGDTWEFRDDEWYPASVDGPSERHGVSMAYDADDGSVVLFGGSTIDKQYGEGTGETWKWDGKKWNKLEIEQPGGIFNASMVYDKDRKELFRFGGWNGKSRINETWFFRENKWSEREVDNGPAPRNHSSLVYDENQKRGVLFGGHDGKNVFGDTWEYADQKWRKISGSEPVERVNNGH